MKERPIITLQRYEKMKKMLRGTTDDVQLVINIVDQCDIEKSLLYILALIPFKYDDFYTMSTRFITSERFRHFLIDEAELGVLKIPVTFDLNMSLSILVSARIKYKKKLSTKEKKFLISEYIEHPKEAGMHTMTKLNPKKRR